MPNQSNQPTSIIRKDAIRLGLTAALFAVILGLALNRDFYSDSMTSAFLSLALASALIILVMLRRSWFDLLLVATGALALAVLDYRIMDFQPLFMASFSFVGMAALGVLGTHTIWSEGDERKLLLYGFLPAVLFVGSEYMASTLLDITEKLHPKAFDLFLVSFEGSLHVQFSFLMGQFFWTHLWVRFVCLVIYIALPLPLALVYAAQLRKKKEAAFAVMLAFLVTGPVGVLFYNMLPAIGPRALFGTSYPFHPPAIADLMHLNVVPILRSGVRNAMPSLHTAWVLLVWWNSQGPGTVDQSDRHGVRDSHDHGNPRHRRTLLRRSGRSLPVRSDGAGAVHLLAAVWQRPAPRRLSVRHVRDSDLDGGA